MSNDGSARGGLLDRRSLAWGIFLAGAAAQVWLWQRAVWLYRDQIELYSLGLDFAREGGIDPVGKLMTGDIPLPGALLQLLIGFPLRLWADYRSPTLVVLAAHLAAGWILWRVLDAAAGRRFAVVFLAVFWLSPWRLYHSGFLWEPAYLMLPAAIHLAACRALRETARPAASALLAATLVLTIQIHHSAVILFLATALLLWRRRIKLHLPAALAGLAAGSITLLPTVTGLLNGAAGPRPDLAIDPVRALNSLQKGLVYWLRLGSLDVGRRLRETVFCGVEPEAAGVGGRLLCGLTLAAGALAALSVLLSLAASWWFLRGKGKASADRSWLRDYALALLAALAVACTLSPASIQGWHVLLVLPAACLPVTAWLLDRWPAAGATLRIAMVLFVALRLPIALLVGLGHPMYVVPETPGLPLHLAPDELLMLLPGGR